MEHAKGNNPILPDTTIAPEWGDAIENAITSLIAAVATLQDSITALEARVAVLEGA
jgi:hypothetical protein